MNSWIASVALMTVILASGCERRVKYVSAFWPGFRGTGQQCIPDGPQELKLVVGRFTRGKPVEKNLAHNVSQVILDFKLCPVEKVVELRQVSDYAILAHAVSSENAKPEQWIFLVGCENIVEIVGYYNVSSLLAESLSAD